MVRSRRDERKIPPRPETLRFLKFCSAYWLTDARPRRRLRNGACMAASIPAPTTPSAHGAIPAALVNVCFVLAVINICLFPGGVFLALVDLRSRTASASRPISSTSGPPARLVLEGHPAQAYDWDDPEAGRTRAAAPGIPRLFRLALSAAVPVRRILAGAVSLRRRLHRLGLGELRALSRHDARDRRPQLRLAARGAPFRWCSTTRWSGRTAFSPRR